jgi:hypothetical protein
MRSRFRNERKNNGEVLMKISRRYLPVLVVTGIMVAGGLVLLLALLIGAAPVRAQPEEATCDGDDEDLCTRDVYCWGAGVQEEFGCFMVRLSLVDQECYPICSENEEDPYCEAVVTCVGGEPKAKSAAIWLADVCEPNDGFSDDGAMTWDTNAEGPLQLAASPEGPWYEVEVNGPPWVVTEENMESFAAMVGLDDWHAMWVRAGDCYPRHVGNTVSERDARMDELCAE